MRKITKDAIKAFNLNRNFSLSNTRVKVDEEGTKLYLHGNLIAEKKDGELFIRNAGWQSNTTKERLNGLHGVSICQKDWTWFLNGKEWDGKRIKVS